MKTISRKEAEKLKTMLDGSRSRVRAEVEAMEVGEIKLLSKAEWTRPAQTPKVMVRQVEARQRRKYSCERLIDGSGWLIERLE